MLLLAGSNTSAAIIAAITAESRDEPLSLNGTDLQQQCNQSVATATLFAKKGELLGSFTARPMGDHTFHVSQSYPVQYAACTLSYITRSIAAKRTYQ